MNAITIVTTCFILSFAFCSCSVNSSDVSHYKSKFEAKKGEFENLVNLLKHEKIRVGYTVNENELSKNVQVILKELDINDIVLNITQCQNVIEYQFTSSWSNKATLYFSKDFCDKEQAVKGYHRKVSDMVEVWGLGNDWIMWIDHDFI